MKIVLASASPRRKELLTQIGLDFQVVVSNIEEKITAHKPREIVEELSRQKAEGCLCQLKSICGEQEIPEILIIGADTIVALDGQILGKPQDKEDAVSMITSLQGRTHQVYTGVTALLVKGNIIQQRTFHEATEVEFFPMTAEEIRTYVDALNPGNKEGTSKWDPNSAPFECEDKAGAYGIQGFCARYIRSIEGDYNNVVGLPVGRLYQEIKDWIG